MHVALQASTLVEIIGPELLPLSYGIIVTSYGLGSIIGPPLFGLLYVYFQGYNQPLYIAGAMFFVGALFYAISYIIRIVNSTHNETDENRSLLEKKY